MSEIADNLARVRERIEAAAARVGRDPEKIKLVAVSKGQSLERIEQAVAAGVEILGENFVQEARRKILKLKGNASWHFVGHLQTNKAKYAVELFDLIHSIDSIKLAQEVDRVGGKQGRRVPVLVQVNISGEQSKFGVERDQAMTLIKETAARENLKLVGLMTIPPLSDDPEKSRPFYTSLRKFGEEVAGTGVPGLELTELSMGMSADYHVAVEEGATLVRVGTAIFGPRGR
jgi:pyridoxal phosphate enzyme (YggS family)